MKELWYESFDADGDWLLELHRMPDWMSPNMHLIIERIIERFSMGYNPLYHFMHGVICGYKMRDIVWFIKIADRGIAP